MKDVRDALMVGRKSDGQLVRRPLSPLFPSFRWPVSMALSIAHRATGVGLSFGALLMTWWLVAAAASEAAFAAVQGFLGSDLGVLLLLGWAAALVLHLIIGVRHLFFDADLGFGPLSQQEPVRRGYETRIYRITGWAAIGLTVIATLIVWTFGFWMWP